MEINGESNPVPITRFKGNPILRPNPALPWQKKATFNPAAIYENDRFHIIYRAQSEEGVSVFGYASSKDGFHIEENLESPIYTPREPFEISTVSGASTGCKDPRITKINDRLYMTYAAYDGINPPRVALTSIRISDFLSKNWQWEKPKLISPPGVGDKDACIVKNRRGNGYLAFHRMGSAIWIDFLEDIDFIKTTYITGFTLASPRSKEWDNIKLGIAAPPIATEQGWLLLYHAACQPGFIYKIGALLLDYENPRVVLARTNKPLMEPETNYEQIGAVPNVIFPGGAIVRDETIYLYYGCANSVVSVATIPLLKILTVLRNNN